MGGIQKTWDPQEYPHQDLTEKILAAAIAVHTELGPGFIEEIYENALIIKLLKKDLKVNRQILLHVFHDGYEVGEHRADLIINDTVVIELKSVADLLPIHMAQARSTLKAAKLQVALPINFNVTRLMDGVKRVVNTW
jgi:GxxExxY protein